MTAGLDLQRTGDWGYWYGLVCFWWNQMYRISPQLCSLTYCQNAIHFLLLFGNRLFDLAVLRCPMKAACVRATILLLSLSGEFSDGVWLCCSKFIHGLSYQWSIFSFKRRATPSSPVNKLPATFAQLVFLWATFRNFGHFSIVEKLALDLTLWWKSQCFVHSLQQHWKLHREKICMVVRLVFNVLVEKNYSLKSSI